MSKRTLAQNKAISTINENLAVNAGAGTGKTKVLTERYIEILDRGSLEKNREVESIVAITFTKKATQEMKDRIRGEIRKNFGKANKWKRFYRDMEKSNISTIHSFCGNILKENPLEAKVDPLFEIMEPSQGKSIVNKLIIEILEDRNHYGSPLYKILTILGYDNLEVFASNIDSLFNKIRSNGESIVDLREKTIGLIESIDIPEGIDDEIIYIFKILMEETRSNSKFNKLAKEEIWTDFLEGDYRNKSRLDILVEFKNFIGNNKKNEDLIEKLEASINQALLEKEKEYLWAYKEIFAILLELESKYEEVKNRESILDYNDLEIRTYKLLKDREDIRYKYQDKYRYIMVDEFQDTNELQKKIFYELCSRDSALDRNNLFVVGDPKQSIYGFRGADVSVFRDVISDIEEVSQNPPINMDINFRSVGLIIDFVNDIFSKTIDDYEPLTYINESTSLKSIEVIEKEDLDPLEGMLESRFAKVYEAGVIADRIEELVKMEGYDYKDIAILFRAGTNDVIYEEALRTRSIPYYNEGGENLYDRQEVLDLLNFLKTMSTGYDLISTIGFLRSPMVGLNDDSIYRLLDGLEDGNIHRRLGECELSDSLENKKLKFAYELLSKYKYEKDIYNIVHILESCIRETNYIDILNLYEDGEQRISNLYKFIDIVRELELTKRYSLEDIIDYIEILRSQGNIEPQAKIRSENSNVVKIMTIHKSKGLQFPVVIIPEMSRSGVVDTSNIIYNKGKGLGFKYEKGASLYEEIASSNRKEEEEEIKRILYVAMTRSEELLILGNQGRARGFKKIIDGMDIDRVRYINYDFNYSLSENTFKEIEEDSLDLIDDSLDIPNLIDFSNFNQKYLHSVNISQYIEFRKCRRKYYYNYYKPIPDLSYTGEDEVKKNILTGTDRGNIVHKFCEVYNGEEDYKIILKEIVEYYGYSYSDKLYGELKVFIDNYVNFYGEDYDRVYSEELFYLKIEDTYINGIIDRIYVVDNKAYIYDFKTNTVGDREDLVDFYKPQLQLYAYAVQKVFEIDVEFAGILFLKDGSIESVDIGSKSIADNMDNIKEFINFVEKYNNIEDYIKSRDCNYCNYRQLCYSQK